MKVEMTFDGATRIIGALVAGVIFSLGIERLTQGDGAGGWSLLGTAIAGAAGFVMLPK
jgi:hypothetical protein